METEGRVWGIGVGGGKVVVVEEEEEEEKETQGEGLARAVPLPPRLGTIRIHGSG
jgi:hypothetical protein